MVVFTRSMRRGMRLRSGKWYSRVTTRTIVNLKRKKRYTTTQPAKPKHRRRGVPAPPPNKPAINLADIHTIADIKAAIRALIQVARRAIEHPDDQGTHDLLLEIMEYWNVLKHVNKIQGGMVCTPFLSNETPFEILVQKYLVSQQLRCPHGPNFVQLNKAVKLRITLQQHYENSILIYHCYARTILPLSMIRQSNYETRKRRPEAEILTEGIDYTLMSYEEVEQLYNSITKTPDVVRTLNFTEL